MYNVQRFVFEVLIGPVDDYVAVAHAGHSSNSYAISYALVYGPIAVFVQCGWGGVYMDKAESTAAVNEMFTLCGQLIDMVDAGAGSLHPPPARLIVSDDRFTGANGLCKWLDQPLDDLDAAQRWLKDAGWNNSPNVHAERNFSWLRQAIEILSGPTRPGGQPS
jgi:hypothetical protein